MRPHAPDRRSPAKALRQPGPVMRPLPHDDIMQETHHFAWCVNGTLRQLTAVDLGDALGSDGLSKTVSPVRLAGGRGNAKREPGKNEILSISASFFAETVAIALRRDVGAAHESRREGREVIWVTQSIVQQSIING